MTKRNKIIVAVSPNPTECRAMLCKLAVKAGFARTAGDAGKIVRQTPYDFDPTNDYFILAENYNFRESPTTTYRLIEMAARGLAVIVGTKKLPKEAEIYCEVFYPNDLNM